MASLQILILGVYIIFIYFCFLGAGCEGESGENRSGSEPRGYRYKGKRSFSVLLAGTTAGTVVPIHTGNRLLDRMRNKAKPSSMM